MWQKNFSYFSQNLRNLGNCRMESRVSGLGRVGWPKWSGWWPPSNRRACTTRGRLSSCSLQSWSVAGAIAATMNKEKLMKMASAVRTGGKGSVRRWFTFAAFLCRSLFVFPPPNHLLAFTRCCFSSILGCRVIPVRGNEKLGFSLMSSWFAAAFLVLFSECTAGVLPLSFAFCLLGFGSVYHVLGFRAFFFLGFYDGFGFM